MKKLTLSIRSYKKINTYPHSYGIYRITISIFDLSKEDISEVFYVVSKDGIILLDDLEGQYKIIVGHIGFGYEYEDLSAYDSSEENQKLYDRFMEFDIDYMPPRANYNSLDIPNFKERELIIEI